MMLKAIIFDLDDTLLNDKRSIQAAFTATCQLAAETYPIVPDELEEKVREEAKEIYASYSTYDFTKKIGINPFEGLWGTFDDKGKGFEALHKIAEEYQFHSWKKGLQALGIDDEKLAKKLASSFPVFRKQYPFVYEDTFPVLERLKEQYQLLLLTNGSPSLQNTKLNLTPRLKDYFEVIVISGDFGHGKPDPSIFHHILEQAGITKEEAIMVGDNLNTDILGSNRIGMKNIWINHQQTKREEVQPTYEIKELKELIPIIEKI